LVWRAAPPSFRGIGDRRALWRSREGGAVCRARAGSKGISPGVEHSVEVEEDAVVQINAIGPWRIDYVDAKDDPRTKPK
jgi:hypothetical protein